MSLLWWILATLGCIAIQSFYSMFEMATVSFNKIRLQYHVSRGSRRARWVHRLLKKPSFLFGTTLLGVNIALQVGSQCSREVYIALDLNPDIAPLTQVFLVLIFAELSPMFAARRYAERVALLSVPVVYASSIVLRPIIWLFGLISRGVNLLVGGRQNRSWSLLSREELQHVVGEPDEGASFNAMVENIFSFRAKKAKDAMVPMHQVRSLPIGARVSDIRELLRRNDVPCVPLYDRSWRHISSIAFPRDLVELEDDVPLREHARPAWFVTQATPLIEILAQFRQNSQSVAIVLDFEGKGMGLLTLDDLLNEIFAEQQLFTGKGRTTEFIERTLPGNMLLSDFNEEFDTHVKGEPEETLAQVIRRHLGHPPETGERVRVGQFDFEVTEVTLLGAKTLMARSAR
jgi:magnesium and cobalt exporter, CNNM family